MGSEATRAGEGCRLHRFVPGRHRHLRDDAISQGMQGSGRPFGGNH
jgi:hypothetical protein